MPCYDLLSVVKIEWSIFLSVNCAMMYAVRCVVGKYTIDRRMVCSYNCAIHPISIEDLPF